MVDGPFYLADRPYYVIDYMLRGESKGSLVYDPTLKEFVTDSEVMRKVFATRDLKTLTLWDPLFYAIGDYTKIPLAAKYETQNVRNFAEFAILTEEEQRQLDLFLEDYEKLSEDIAECSKVTNSILYPKEAYSFKYSRSPPNILIEIYETSARGHFSYEGFQQLLKIYDKIYSDYLQLGLDLNAFAGGLEEYPPGTTIREKWEIVVTKESILKEIELANMNAQKLDSEISVRKDILSWDYRDRISMAKERLGIEEVPRAPKKGICGPTFVLLIALTLIFLLYKRRLILPILLTGAVLALISTPILSQEFRIPTPEELISQKVTSPEEVSIEIAATGIDEATAKEVLRGFPLFLKGESVVVRGPYYYYGEPNYIFDIVKGKEPTGYLFLVDAVNFRLIGDQRKAFQLQKARFLADLIEGKPLYQGANIEAIAEEAEKATTPPLDMFLSNLTENIREGKKLEQEMVERPDFETLKELTKHYIQGFILLQNIERLTSPSEAMKLTHGFSERMLWLEAYGRVSRGLSADEYLEARRSQYRGRTLNRLPLMQQLAGMGMLPSKAQVVHDLTSDLLYDNIFIWHLEKVEDPALFARLAFKEGTFTMPSIFNTTTGG